MAIKMGERMAKLENEVINIKESNTKEHLEIKEMISDFIDSADSKYAPKWIGTILAYVCSILSIVVAAGLIKFIWG